MTARKRRTGDLRALCAQVHDDDGVDPREAFSRLDTSRTKGHRKARQLCKQVLRAIDTTLAGDCGDPLLLDLQVLAVDPAPDASHLLVTVQLSGRDESATVEAAYARLEQVGGFLRSEIARAITRKRAPQLSFRVLTRKQVEP